MTESRKELIKIIMKENALKKINNFLYLKVTKKRHESKTNLPNKINEVDVATVNELLIKKILEYRQVRNYNNEEENSLKDNAEIINKKVTELRNKSYKMMDNIIKKQDKLIDFYENLQYDSQASVIMKMKQLINEHSRLLVRFCCILDEKQKRSIKLFWRSENKREMADYQNTSISYITFDNLQHQNKSFREKLADRKEKIKHEKDKLDEIILLLDNIRRKIKEIEAHINKSVIPLLIQNKERCLQASSDINTKLQIRSKFSSGKALLLKKLGILKYENLVQHCRIIKSDFIKL